MTVGSPQQCNQQSRNPIQPLSSAERADDVCSVYHNKNSPAVTEPLRKRTLSSKPQTFRSPLKQEKKSCCLVDPTFQKSSRWCMCWSVLLTFFLTTVVDVKLTVFTGSLESRVAPSFAGPPDWKPSSTIILSGFERHSKLDFSLILLL